MVPRSLSDLGDFVDLLLKQRLTGAIVLVSLAVIFIPMLLSSKGEMFFSRNKSNIPPLPSYEIKAPNIKIPDQIPQFIDKPESVIENAMNNGLDTIGTETTAKSAGVAGEKKPSSQGREKGTDTKPAPKEIMPGGLPAHKDTAVEGEGGVTGWIVQVGSFSIKKNAIKLRDKLRKKGYASFLKERMTKKGITYRVRIGPELRRLLAEKLQKALDKDMNLKGLVMRYP